MNGRWIHHGELHGTGYDVHAGPGTGSLTLVDGPTFCICDARGDIRGGTTQGLYFADTRYLSALWLDLDGTPPELLATHVSDPGTAAFIYRARPAPGAPDSTLLVERERHLGRGMREDLVVRNHGREPAYCRLAIHVGADLGDLFAVKAGTSGDAVVDATVSTEDVATSVLTLVTGRAGRRRGVQLTFSGASVVEADGAVFEAIVPAGGRWETCVEVAPVVDDEVLAPGYACGQSVDRSAARIRLARWRAGLPTLDCDHDGVTRVVTQSVEDLAALRLYDPDVPERAVVAAGAPWFMGLFGRDALLTSWMALPLDPALALGVLETLARLQGSEVDDRTEQEPGRIVHEVRFAPDGRSLTEGHLDYSSVDASPLFVMLLGELRRWGLAPEVVERLMPHADRALDWILGYGDRDGDGYVEYQRRSDRGLTHQGWKDSPDGIRFSDGRLASAPIALCEVQAYVYAAYVARAHFAAEARDEETEAVWRTRAAELKAAFNRDFWIEKHGWIAVGLDADKEPIDALASNMGHCLWTGILDEDRAAEVAERIADPDLFSGWGVRTLAASMRGYNPIGYQTGSVWPHDTAIVAAGLMRYGYVEPAQRLAMGVFDAAVASGGRLPELFSGLDRDEFPIPVSYPTSCAPQAWASAAPFLLLRTLLRFDPSLPAGRIWLAPALPPEIGRLRIEDVPMLGGKVTVSVDGDHVEITDLPDGVEWIREPRAPLTAPA